MAPETVYSATITGIAETLAGALASTSVEEELHWRDGAGQMALHRACHQGYTECVRMLIEAGAAVEATDDASWTPLHFACSKHRVDCAKLLLEAGANPDAANSRGNTPMHLAGSFAAMAQPLRHAAPLGVLSEEETKETKHLAGKLDPLQQLLASHGAALQPPDWLRMPRERPKHVDEDGIEWHDYWGDD